MLRYPRRLNGALLVAATFVALSGCGDDEELPPVIQDSGVDAATDGGARDAAQKDGAAVVDGAADAMVMDAVADRTVDGGVADGSVADAVADVVMDAVVDAVADAPTEARAVDAAVDGGVDGGPRADAAAEAGDAARPDGGDGGDAAVLADAGGDGAVGEAAADTGATDALVDALSAAIPTSDADIFSILNAADSAELDEAQLAVTNASSARVKAFAERMIEEHTAHQARIGGLAATIGVKRASNEMSTSIDQTSKGDLAALKPLSGPSFDRTYMASQIAAHRALLTLIDCQLLPDRPEGSLRTELQNTRAVVSDHLLTAERIENVPSFADIDGGCPPSTCP